jgi:flotillin
MYEILTKQALGLEQIVKAAGDDAKDAVFKIEVAELVKTQAEAIKNIKITVWENGGGKDGKTSTSNFISGMYKAIPPLQEIFNMAGMQLSNYLKGEAIEDSKTNDSSDEKEIKNT